MSTTLRHILTIIDALACIAAIFGMRDLVRLWDKRDRAVYESNWHELKSINQKTAILTVVMIGIILTIAVIAVVVIRARFAGML